MANRNATQSVSADTEELKRQWLDRLNLLVDSIETWARELGWSTRRIMKNMEDLDRVAYKAPGLLLQEEFTKGLLEPISEGFTGLGGRVDLYLMPAYDDVAHLLYTNGVWSLHRLPPGMPAVGLMEEHGPGTLSKETLGEILESMKAYDAR
jgi:hypothetical protein